MTLQESSAKVFNEVLLPVPFPPKAEEETNAPTPIKAMMDILQIAGTSGSSSEEDILDRLCLIKQIVGQILAQYPRRLKPLIARAKGR